MENRNEEVKLTKDSWIKAFKEKFEKVVERFDDGSYITEGINPEMIEFISQVEKDAIEKTNKRWNNKLRKLAWDIKDEDGAILDTVVSLSDLLEDE